MMMRAFFCLSVLFINQSQSLEGSISGSAVTMCCTSAGSGHGGTAGHRGRRRLRKRRPGPPCWWVLGWILTEIFQLTDSRLCSPQLVSWTPWPPWGLQRTDMESVTSLVSSIRKSSTAGRYGPMRNDSFFHSSGLDAEASHSACQNLY